MSNIIQYSLEVLGSSPTEINQIAGRLLELSPELVNQLAERFGKPPSEVAENLKTLLEFEVTGDPGNSGKECDFALSLKVLHTDIVDSHLLEVSEGAPSAIFLLTYYDPVIPGNRLFVQGKWFNRSTTANRNPKP